MLSWTKLKKLRKVSKTLRGDKTVCQWYLETLINYTVHGLSFLIYGRNQSVRHPSSPLRLVQMFKYLTARLPTPSIYISNHVQSCLSSVTPILVENTKKKHVAEIGKNHPQTKYSIELEIFSFGVFPFQNLNAITQYIEHFIMIYSWP